MTEVGPPDWATRQFPTSSDIGYFKDIKGKIRFPCLSLATL